MDLSPSLDASAANVERTPDTVFFVGDSITLGWRDEEIRGWPLRVVAALGPAAAVTAYNLGIRGDTSDNILARWQDEVRRRLRPQASTIIVFAFGANDAKGDASGRLLDYARRSPAQCEADPWLGDTRSSRAFRWTGAYR